VSDATRPSTRALAARLLAAMLPTPAPAAAPESITVRQDVGGHYPQYKQVTLDLHEDGSVTWRDLEWP
jgi:hypothetical protein